MGGLETIYFRLFFTFITFIILFINKRIIIISENELIYRSKSKVITQKNYIDVNFNFH